MRKIKTPKKEKEKINFLYWNSKKLISKKIKGSSEFKITVKKMIDEIKRFLKSTKFEGIQMIQKQHMFDTYKFYAS